MGACSLSRVVQVDGYAVRIVCELPDDDHIWHFDSTYSTEWEEPEPKASIKTLTVRTPLLVSKQPLVA